MTQYIATWTEGSFLRSLIIGADNEKEAKTQALKIGRKSLKVRPYSQGMTTLTIFIEDELNELTRWIESEKKRLSQARREADTMKAVNCEHTIRELERKTETLMLTAEGYGYQVDKAEDGTFRIREYPTFTEQELELIIAIAKRHSKEAKANAEMCQGKYKDAMMKWSEDYDIMSEKATAMLRAMG